MYPSGLSGVAKLVPSVSAGEVIVDSGLPLHHSLPGAQARLTGKLLFFTDVNPVEQSPGFYILSTATPFFK